MTETDLCEVTITTPDRDWLVDLCHKLVDARLASSAQVVHPITSIYRWEGTLHHAIEARAFVRSRAALVDEIAAFVVERHPYEVPNITAVPVLGGNPRYLAWVRTETAERKSKD